MCSCRGASEQIKSLGEEMSILFSASETWGGVAGIRSCTSASTGGGEGCLITAGRTGVSIVSKEIKEQGSSSRHFWLSSCTLRIDSKLDLPGSELLCSDFTNSSAFTDSCSLFSQRDHPRNESKTRNISNTKNRKRKKEIK